MDRVMSPTVMLVRPPLSKEISSLSNLQNSGGTVTVPLVDQTLLDQHLPLIVFLSK